MKKLSLPVVGFLQATGVVAYICLVGWFMFNVTNFFKGEDNFLAPVFAMILFVTSALITASMALGYPILLFWEEKKVKESIRLVLFTTGWLFSYFLFFIILLSLR